MATAFMKLEGISKYFAKVVANRDVTFEIGRGEVLALLGENGAGKSTIMKILYGLYKADEGAILRDGEEVKINSPKDAMKLGISMIQQHFSLVPAHTVIENIILGNVHGVVRQKQFQEEIKKLAETYCFDLDPNELVCDLAGGDQQKVEILKALYQNVNLLIMDEPTAVLTPQESNNLMEFIRNFSAKGNSVVFITHKLKEVMQVADRIVVMRAGEVCGNVKRDETNEFELSRLMIGRDLKQVTREHRHQYDERKERLKLENIHLQEDSEVPVIRDISLTIHEGEIFAIAGVRGNGQKELCEVVGGARSPTEGTITLDGIDITSNEIRSRIESGIGYVPADRYKDGMVMEMTVAENLMLKNSYDKKWCKGGLIDKKRLARYTMDEIQEYSIKAPSPDAVARGLSGGNQQKVVLAREVENGEKVMVLDQPTRGLDLGAVNHIHNVILTERSKGKSILLVSTELSEIFTLADRIAVLYKGEIQGVFDATELTIERIGLLMAGVKVEEGHDDVC